MCARRGERRTTCRQRSGDLRVAIVTLAFLTGLLCIAASFLRLGALADFLSRPILVGFLNGVALSIILGQADKIFGFPVVGSGILPRLAEIVGKLGDVHGPTLAVALGTFAIITFVPRFVPQLPAALVGMVLAGAFVLLFNLTTFGVKTVGYVPAGLPFLALPHVDSTLWPALLAEAAGLADARRCQYCIGHVARLRREWSGFTNRHQRCSGWQDTCRGACHCCNGRARASVLHGPTAIRAGGTWRGAYRRCAVADRSS